MSLSRTFGLGMLAVLCIVKPMIFDANSGALASLVDIACSQCAVNNSVDGSWALAPLWRLLCDIGQAAGSFDGAVCSDPRPGRLSEERNLCKCLDFIVEAIRGRSTTAQLLKHAFLSSP